MATGQTEGLRSFGVEDCYTVCQSLVEWYWESQPERVKAPYTKGGGSEQDPEYCGTRGTLQEAGGTTLQA